MLFRLRNPTRKRSRLWRYLRRYLMPVDTNRLGNPDAVTNADRLDMDHGGPINWTCQACDQPQMSRPEQGCQFCKAGAPGVKGAISLPYTPPEAFDATRPAPAGPAGPSGPAGIAAGSIAAALAQKTKPGLPGTVQLDEIRAVVRDELRAVLGGLTLTPKEKTAVLEGLMVVHLHYETLTPEQQGTLPTPAELAVLAERIQQS